MNISFPGNRFVKYLVLGDLIFFTGWGLVAPVFAIFVIQKIEGGNALVAGLASGIYWALKSLLRVPFGLLLDSRPSDRDDYFALVVGFFISALVSFGFIFASLPWHIYLLQGIRGVGMALGFSGWTGIFTRHIDKGRESTEWGLDATSVGLGTGIASAIGGWAVIQFGFELVFFTVGVLGVLTVIILLGLRNDIKGVFDGQALKKGIYFHLKDIFQREKH